ncbi:MAG: DUF7560 family zinc ribbon protein [Natronomonas sp.]
MTKYRFSCPGCEQQIEVNEAMREAILSKNCPVCSEHVGETHFEVI